MAAYLLPDYSEHAQAANGLSGRRDAGRGPSANRQIRHSAVHACTRHHLGLCNWRRIGLAPRAKCLLASRQAMTQFPNRHLSGARRKPLHRPSSASAWMVGHRRVAASAV
jgi:hypothetical protein